MRKTCTRTLSLLSVIVFIGLSSSMAAEIPVVHGRLHSPARELIQGLFVILEENSSHTETSRADVRGDGSFEFRDIPAGDYTLRVTDGFGLTVCQQFVTIHDHMPQLEVRLPERESDGAGAGGGDRVGKATDASAPQKGSAGVSVCAAFVGGGKIRRCGERTGEGHPHLAGVRRGAYQPRRAVLSNGPVGGVDGGVGACDPDRRPRSAQPVQSCHCAGPAAIDWRRRSNRHARRCGWIPAISRRI